MPAAQPDRRTTAFTAASVPENYQRHLAPAVFAPWAEILVRVAGVQPGDRVLDVASGTGVVARAAARVAGPRGRVIASDVSGPMLAYAAGLPLPHDAAPVDYQEASATDLPFAGDSFDVVLCQQGLQFFPKRLQAVREMARVLRSGGVVAASVWAAGHRLQPFDEYAEALAATGAEPPFPRAFDNATFVMGPDEARELFHQAGLAAAEVSTVEQSVRWADPASVVAGILGTPFGPLVEALPADRRQALDADLARRLAPEEPGGSVTRATAAVMVHAVKP